LIICAAYTANLASFLVAEQFTVSSVGSISDAVALQNPICIQEGAGHTERINRRYPNANLVYTDDGVDNYGKLRDGKCELAIVTQSDLDRLTRSRAFNADCGIAGVPTSTNTEFYTAGGPVVMDDGACTDLVRQTIGLLLFEMVDDGFLEKAWDRFYFERDGSGFDCRADAMAGTDDSRAQSLDEKDVGGIFLLHFVVSFVALIVAAAGYFKREMWEKPSSGLKPQNQAPAAINTTPAGGSGDNLSPGALGASSSSADAHLHQFLAAAVEIHFAKQKLEAGKVKLSEGVGNDGSRENLEFESFEMKSYDSGFYIEPFESECIDSRSI
jgi:hypothetical protein